MKKNFFHIYPNIHRTAIYLIFIRIFTRIFIGFIGYFLWFNPLSNQYSFGMGVCIDALNDDCINATALVVNAPCVNGNTCGSVELGESTACSPIANQTVWYSFIATDVTVAVVVENLFTGGCNLGSSVWDGSTGCLPSGLLSCQNISGAPVVKTHSLTGLTVGNTYYVRLEYERGGVCDNEQTFCIKVADNIDCVGNNICGSSCLVALDSTCYKSTLEGATDDWPGIIGCQPADGHPEVWFTATPSGDTLEFTVDSIGAGFTGNVELIVAYGSCVGLIIDSFSCGPAPFNFKMPVTPGVQYWWTVSSGNGSNGPNSTFQICVKNIGCPPYTANAGPDAMICAGSSYTTLGASIGGGATNSIWTTSGTGTFSNPAMITTIYSPSPADIAAGSVTLTITTNDPDGPGSCLAATDSMVLAISQTVTAFPYVQNFDAFTPGTPGILLDDWMNIPGDDFDWYVNTGGTSSFNTGPDADHTTGTGNYMYTESSWPNYPNKTAILVTPCIDISTLTNPFLQFWYHMYGANMGTLYIDIYDVSSGILVLGVASISGNQGNQWLLREVDLSAFSGVKRIMFRGVTGSDFTSDIAIDDVKIYDKPPNDVGVIAILAPNTGCSLSAIESVTIRVKNFGTLPQSSIPVSYRINGGPAVNETITTLLNPGNAVNFTFAATANLSTPGTYIFDAWTSLSSDTNKINDSITNYMVKHLAPVITFPYKENFDAFITGTPGILLNDWVNAKKDDFDWYVNTGTTPTLWTGPDADHTSGSGNYMYTEADNNYPAKTAILISPCIDISSLSNPFLEFWYHMYGSWMGKLYIDIESGGVWTTVDSIVGPQVNNWLERQVNLAAFSGTTIRIGFRGVIGSWIYSDMAIDDVKVYDKPPNDVGVIAFGAPNSGCGLSANEPVTISVKNFGLNIQDTIPVSYSVNGVPQVTEIITTNINPGATVVYTFSTTADLSAPGVYTFDAWTSLTGDGDNSNDSTMGYKVVHIAPLNTFPYLEDFESGTLGKFIKSGKINKLEWVNTEIRGSDPGHSATHSAYFGNPADTSYNTGLIEGANLTLPCLDFTNLDSVKLNFNYFLETENFSIFDKASVSISTDNVTYTDIADNNIIGNLIDPSSAWLNLNLDISAYSGSPVVYIRFSFNTVDAWLNKFEGFYIDDINIFAIFTGPCIALSTNSTGVLCSGDSNGTATVNVDSLGTPPYTYAWNTNPVQTDSIATGLSAGTYQVIVNDAIGCTDTAAVIIPQPLVISTTTPDDTICTGDSALIFGIYRFTAGTYYDSLTAINGCDSIIETTLIVNGPTTFIVDTTSDAGAGSLRQAIIDANNNCGHDTIIFDLGAGGPFTIGITSVLPDITDNSGVTIDGWRNIGNAGTPNTVPVFSTNTGNPMDATYKINLGNSSNVPTGLVLASDSNIIQGLVLQDFGDGTGTPDNNDIAIKITGSNNHVLGCYIGMDFTGTTKGTKTAFGISISGANNQIGNGTPAASNLISGMNGFNDGILIMSSNATGNSVKGNIIGLQEDGSTLVSGAQQWAGVSIKISAASNTIGGSGAGEGNVISGNRVYGIEISLAAAGNSVLGNIIGPQADGISYVDSSLQNYGINIDASPNNTIGGNTAGARNIISANATYGVHLQGSGSTGNVVKGNYIGIDKNGTTFISGSTQDNGVYITPSSGGNNTIGGSGAGEGNVISGNSYYGIYNSGTANSILGNIIGPQADGVTYLSSNLQARGIDLNAAQNNIIGGSTTGERNIISANDYAGIMIEGASSGNIVKGNYIGIAQNGTSFITNSNQDYGVYISNISANNIIGGSGAGEGNVLSGNTNLGVHLNSSAVAGNSIIGNIIGPQADGISYVGSNAQSSGVYINQSPNNTIGGNIAGERNIISANELYGVVITGPNSIGNAVKGNYIGPDSGSANIGGASQIHGIYIANGASDNIIGGSGPGEANLIAFNTLNGCYLLSTTTTGNKITRNPIYNNTDKPIELNYGVNQANNGNPAPVITIATETNVSGTSAPNNIIEVFKNITADCFDAEYFIDTITADGSGNWSLTGLSLTIGDYVLATATDISNNTSEFSGCLIVTLPGCDTIIITTTGNDSVCPGICDGTISASASGGAPPYTYVIWNNTFAVMDSFANNLCADTFYVTVQDSAGCSAIDSVIIFELPFEDPSFSYSPSEYCQNESNPSPTGMVTPGTFSASGTLVINSATGEIDLAASDTGSYIITYTTGGPCPDSSNFGITILPAPDATITTIPGGPLCGDDSPINLVAANTGGTWSGNGIIDSINGIFDPVSAGPGIDTVTYTLSSAGCSDSDSVNISVLPIPSVSISGDTAICQGDSTTFALTFSGFGPFDVEYYMGTDTINTYIVTGLTTGDSVTFNPAFTTTYTLLSLTGAMGCPGNAGGSVTINIIAAPPAPIAGPDATYCYGDLVDSITATGINIEWFSDAGLFNLIGTGSPFAIAPGVGTTTYYVTQTDSGCQSPADSVRITIFDQGFIDAGKDTVICFGESTQLKASGGTGYQWYPVEGLNDPGIASPFANPSQTTTYYVQVSIGDSCVFEDSVIVTVKNLKDCWEIYNTFSPNSDGKNDTWIIDGIQLYITNKVTIFNRWKDLVNEFENYDNETEVWDGTNKNGTNLPDGTYFYIIDIGEEQFTGWVQIAR